MSIRVSMKFSADSVYEMIDGYEERLADLRPAFLIVQKVFYNLVRNFFDTQGDGSWAPLAESTIRKKVAANQNNGILVATKQLRNSLTAQNQKYARRIITRQMMEIGTVDPIAVYHANGTEHMPARDPLGLHEEDLAIMIKVIEDYALGKLDYFR